MHILSVCFSSSYKDSSSTWSNTSHHPTSFFLCKTPLLKDNAPRDCEMMSSKGRERNIQNNQWMRAGFRSLWFVWWKSSSTDPVQVWVRRARTLCLRLTPTLVHPTGSWATKVLLQLPAWYGQSHFLHESVFLLPHTWFCIYLLPSSFCSSVALCSLWPSWPSLQHTEESLVFILSLLHYSSLCWRRMFHLKYQFLLLDYQNSPISRWCVKICGKQLPDKKKNTADHYPLHLSREKQNTYLDQEEHSQTSP